MARSSRPGRNQRILWLVSILVILSMAFSFLFSFTPRVPRVTPTPTVSLFPTYTPTPTSGTH